MLAGAAALLCGCQAAEDDSATPLSPPPSTAGAGAVYTSTGGSCLGEPALPGGDTQGMVGVRAGDGPDGPLLADVVDVAGGRAHSLAALEDGRVLAWGENETGQLGDAGTTGSAEPVEVVAPAPDEGALGDVTAVAADTDFSMALRADGTVVTWGESSAGQRGTGPAPASLRPTVVLTTSGAPLDGVVSVAADGRTAMAVREDGTVLAWGSNSYGQLGDGTTADRALPGPVLTEAGGPALQGVQDVSVGGQHGVALLETGEVMAWGRNDTGQLGDGTTADRPVPRPVALRTSTGGVADVVAVSAAEKFTLALLADTTVLGWGSGAAGQLGRGTVAAVMGPGPVLASFGGSPLRGVQDVAAGEAYGVALLADGSARSWGAGRCGQLGDPASTGRSLPGPVPLPATAGQVLDVGAAEQHLLLVARERPSAS